VQTEIETPVPRPRAAIGSARARLASVLGRQRAKRRLDEPTSRNAPTNPVHEARAQATGGRGYLADRFRLPTPDDAAPEQRRLIGVCAWAGLLGIGGVTIALRVLLALFQVDSSWYPVKACAIGLVGLMFTVAAFASVHRPVLPWTMLTCATGALVAGIVVTASA
jgi:hypothetical protein